MADIIVSGKLSSCIAGASKFKLSSMFLLPSEKQKAYLTWYAGQILRKIELFKI